MEGDSWRSIESVPNKPVLLYFPKTTPERPRDFVLGEMWRVGCASDYPYRHPTHWKPLDRPSE